MHVHCPSCNLKYEPEPGFFYGAMYVSYALSIMLVGLTWFVFTLAGFEFWAVIWTIIPLLLIAIPFLFKISRAIWMNLFIHYDKDMAAGKNRSEEG